MNILSKNILENRSFIIEWYVLRCTYATKSPPTSRDKGREMEMF